MKDAEHPEVVAYLDRIVARTNAIADRLDRVTHAPRPAVRSRLRPAKRQQRPSNNRR